MVPIEDDESPLRRAFASAEPYSALDRPALEIARIEFPSLDPVSTLDLLDHYADEIQRRLNQGRGEFLDVAAQFLFDELGFKGNAADYYNPRNSCLNTVVESRTGIPITLAVVYLEVARRLGEPVFGISLPGHFVTEYRKGAFSIFVDPFHARFRSRGECVDLVREVAGLEIDEQHASFAPAPSTHILVRMLNNLRVIYFQRRAFPKLLRVLDWLRVADPGSGDWLRQHAVASAELKRFGSARESLEAYLRLFPEAEDRKHVEEQIRQLGRRQALSN